ncbi:hypothetical protein [Methylomagnum sp.]
MSHAQYYLGRDYGWDIEVYGRDQQLVLVGEVKSKIGVSPQWAAQFRRNILAHGVYPNAPYLLMAFPDRFYLWKNAGLNPGEIEPTHSIDARPILEPYFKRAGILGNRISGQSFELIIASWLSEIIHASLGSLDSSQQWLIESGLYDAVAGGSLDHGVPA